MALLSEAVDVYIDGQRPEAVMLGDEFKWGHRVEVVDDFNGTRNLTIGQASVFYVDSPGEFDGSPSLRHREQAAHEVTVAPLTISPYTGGGRRVISVRVKLTGPTAPLLGGIALWPPSGAQPNSGYQFCIDSRRGDTGSAAGAQIRRNVSTAPVASGGLTGLHPMVNVPYRLEAEYNTSLPRLRFRVYTDDGVLLKELTSNDAIWNGPVQVGVYGYNNVAFDDLKITYST